MEEGAGRGAFAASSGSRFMKKFASWILFLFVLVACHVWLQGWLKVTVNVLALFLSIVVILAFSPVALPFRELVKKPRRGILHERFAPSKVNDEFDAIILGSGMAGLTCAATLSRFGMKILVLEQHDVAGGGTHTFVLEGKTDYVFDSGLHYTVPQSGELIQLACGTRRLPIKFGLLGEADDNGATFDRVVLGDVTEAGFRIKHGMAHVAKLREMFPDEKDQRELDEFLRVATKINALIPLWILSKALPKWARHLWKRLFLGSFTFYAKQTGAEVTNKIVSNPTLAAILLGLWMDAGCPPDRATFMMTAALSVGFPKEGGAYPTGGSELMASNLIQGIETSGGQVLVRASVKEILVEKDRAVGVYVNDGKGTKIYAPIIISACGFGNTYGKLVPKHALPREYVFSSVEEVSQEIDNSASWIMTNIGIKASPEELGLECSNVWVQPCHKSNGYNLFKGIRDYFESPLEVEQIPMMITFPSIKDRACQAGKKGRTTCQILALSGKGWFDKWESENGKHPEGGEYESLKKKWLDKLTDSLLKRYPAMKGKLELVDLSTPLSIKYYLRKPGGGAVGLDLNPERFYLDEVEDMLDMQSPIKNLWLTGEDTLLCGVPMAQLSGLLTAFRVVGLRKTLRFVLWVIRLAISDQIEI